LAYWLAQYGFKPTLLERAAAPRPGGQAIDVRGVALNVLHGMGLLQDARNLHTQMKGASIIDSQGKELWRTEGMTFTGGAFDKKDIEILRDDLAGLLLDKARPGTELIYNDSVTTLTEDKDGVAVTFEKGAARRFDLVVGADGLHSPLRRMVFGEESQYLTSMGMALAVYSTTNHLGLKNWQLAYRQGKENCLIYTARDNTQLRIGFGFDASLADEHVGDIPAQKSLLVHRFRNLRWEIPKLLHHVWSAQDFYMGIVAQVRMPHCTRGRIALVGDAGYCPSPFSGQGTSLALVGAYLLAYELAQSPGDHAGAFTRYEDKLRPFVEMNQAVAHLAKTDGVINKELAQSQLIQALDAAKNGIDLQGLAARAA
jgi:2-polyprenyl-6-methoxyphenol hydroxylase-like FAD-dependent oxidoreductase